MGPEDKFKARILKELHARGGWWYTTPRTRFGRAGIPDILGCFFGRFFAIEVKRPDGVGSYKVTPSQRRVLTVIEENEGQTWVVDDEESLQAFLEELDEWTEADRMVKTELWKPSPPVQLEMFSQASLGTS